MISSLRLVFTAAWVMALLAGALTGLQLVIDRHTAGLGADQEILYLQSGKTLKKLALGHEGLLADLYWMRAVQYYGEKRLRRDTNFKLLAPLIEIAVTLDPHLMEAYNVGAILLSEPKPVGADQPPIAVAFLKKGIENNPEEWILHRNLGFVYYWYLNDFPSAARAFFTGSKNPQAARWMKTMAAELMAHGGSRQSARFLWQELYQTSTNSALKENARENLFKLTAEEEIEWLQSLIDKVEARIHRRGISLGDLVSLGLLKSVPADPKGFPYIIDPASGKVALNPASTIRR
jgi:hypothetical protein